MIATGPLPHPAFEPAVPPVAIIPATRQSDPTRRTRIEPTVDPELRGWLQRAARAHAHIAAIVRLYGRPSKAGGQSLLGEGYAERVARGDRTLLFDCVSFARDELDGIRDEIQCRMDSASPTEHKPGTREKVDVLADRLHRGDSLFIPGDAKK
jgi:hypothetical protein